MTYSRSQLAPYSYTIAELHGLLYLQPLFCSEALWQHKASMRSSQDLLLVVWSRYPTQSRRSTDLPLWLGAMQHTQPVSTCIIRASCEMWSCSMASGCSCCMLPVEPVSGNRHRVLNPQHLEAIATRHQPSLTLLMVSNVGVAAGRPVDCSALQLAIDLHSWGPCIVSGMLQRPDSQLLMAGPCDC